MKINNLNELNTPCLILDKNLLEKSGVKIFLGFESFIDKNTIEVSKKKIVAKNILIAVGSEPRKINFSAKDKIINSDQAFDIKKFSFEFNSIFALPVISILPDIPVEPVYGKAAPPPEPDVKASITLAAII